MIVFRDPSEVPADFGPSVVAIGKFDGVHSGHRAVLDRARVDAATGDARVAAVTFDRNPLALLRPELCPEDLIGVHQKVQLLAETGIDATLVLRFDEELANLTAREFVQRVLVDALRVRTVMVGADFRFDPPTFEPFPLPSLAVCGTGKRVGSHENMTYFRCLACARIWAERRA